ncbi:MAG: hypothetical protein ACREID_06305, partial [Planctomycetota bacterium]
MRPLPFLLFAAAAAAGERAELLRDDRFNFRILGRLPRGWSRVGEGLEFTFTVEEIPHAHVRLVRERVEGSVDVRAEVERRASGYRFPSAPPAAPASFSGATWGGRPAVLYEHETEARGVRCRRRVLALHAKGVWYELFETVYGDAAADPLFLDGRKLFQEGFRLLAPPLPPEADRTAAREEIRDEEAGFRLLKPEGWRRLEP